MKTSVDNFPNEFLEISDRIHDGIFKWVHRRFSRGIFGDISEGIPEQYMNPSTHGRFVWRVLGKILEEKYKGTLERIPEEISGRNYSEIAGKVSLEILGEITGRMSWWISEGQSEESFGRISYEIHKGVSEEIVGLLKQKFAWEIIEFLKQSQQDF